MTKIARQLRVNGPQKFGRKRPLFIDVFAGCGGLSLGLKRAGWNGLFAIEKDKFAFATLSANFHPSGKFDYSWPDEIERQAWDIDELIRCRRAALVRLRGKVDLLAGGPPCQGFSYAGRRLADDPRNKLFEDYLKLVSIIRPTLVLIENVRGFTDDFKTADNGEIFNFAETLVARLGKDYTISHSIVRACDFGIPQTRPRFFLVGALKTHPSAPKVAHVFDALALQSTGFLAKRGLPKSPTAWGAISDLELARNKLIECPDSPGFKSIFHRRANTRYQRVMRDGHRKPTTDTRLAKHRPEIRDRFASIIESCREEGRLSKNISSTLRQAFALNKMAIRVLDPLGIAPTITSLPDDLLHYAEPRTLTVRENARLQSFPDWFVFKGKYTTGGDRRRKEVPRFTQVANAVPPLLAEQFGLILLRILKG
jgi:DNA (cytosine-5)-methyltransferase 1